MRLKFIVSICLLLFVTFSNGQTGGDAMRYQAVLRNSSGVIVANKLIAVKIGIYSNPVLYWEETHSVTTNADGLFVIEIGKGSTTGAGTESAYPKIDWRAHVYEIQIAIDNNGGTVYQAMGYSKLMSVPYAFQSLKSDTIQSVFLSDLKDINESGKALNYLLKWDGTVWKTVKDNDSDTVSFAMFSGHALHVDTVSYALKSLDKADSVNYANNTTDALKAINSENSANAAHSITSDTAEFGVSLILFNWATTGNKLLSTAHFIGTKDSTDVVFKTSNTEKVRLLPTKKTGIGVVNPFATLHIKGIDGFVSQGTLGSGIVNDSTAGTKFIWYPRKAAVCMGTQSLGYWGSSKIGNYSFSAGYNCKSLGVNCVSMGIHCFAMDSSGVSMGRNCYNYRIPSDPDGFGGSIAMGDSAVVNFTRGIGIGSHVISKGASIYGYRNAGSGGSSTVVFGCYNIANTPYSMVLGTNANTNGKTGCFLFSDASSTSPLLSTQNNQFMVRASGGFIFYTDTLKTTGVQVASGSGSWSMLSDKTKKENFESADGVWVLNKINNLSIRKWEYKAQKGKIKHIGPTAQDFYAAFCLGESNCLISTVDMNGITLLGIKSLEKQTGDYLERLKSLSISNVEAARLKSDFNELDSRLKNIETLLNK
jgi:hypothetical protein